MGTSFVSVDGSHGFWMRDDILELWLRLLSLHVLEPGNTDPASTHAATKRIRDGWLRASKGWFGGMVPHQLEEAVAEPEGRRIIKGAISSLVGALSRGSAMIDRNTLNLLGIEKKQFKSDVDRKRLIAVGAAFLDLLDGKITATARSTEFMPGSR